jgi:cytochrome c
MDNRTNTIAGWALGAMIVALGGGIVTAELFHGDRPETMGYPIEGVVVEGEAGEAAVPIETLLAAADPAAGQQVFAKCAACHTINKGGANGIGPNLWGSMGKAHGHVPGFAYSDALKSKPGVWDWTSMDAWLASPRKYAEGTKMTFAGLSKPEDRANLIAYLNQQSDSPLPMPAAPAAAPAEATPPAEGEADKAADTATDEGTTPPGAPSVDPAAAERAADQ